MNDDSTPSTTPPADRRRRVLLASAAGVAAATLALMLATEPRLAIAWDEGYTLGREERVRLWFRALRDPAAFARSWTPPDPRTELVQVDARVPRPPEAADIDTRAKLFRPRVLAWFWPFAREEPHGHPPFYALVGLIGDLVVPGWSELPRARFGPILAFSLTAGALFGFTARRWGPWAGAATAGAWALQPQLFGHGHYAAYDGLLTCLWVDAILAFWLAIEPGDDGVARRRPRWGWAIALGVLLGWAADTKLTGWFLPLPFLAWVGLCLSAGAKAGGIPQPDPPPRGGRGLSEPSPLAGEGLAGSIRGRTAALVAAVAAPVALLMLYLFNPGWWANPVGGVERFFRSNLTRGQTIPIPVRFLGTTYNTPNESLPWYNTLAWTAMATPVGFLVLALAGIVRAFARRRAEPFGMLVLGHWAFLMFLRALPHTPGHDGVRLFLPAFGVLAILAGLGAASLVGRWGRWGKALVAAALLEGAASVAVMMPVPLSYFSPIVGGLPGAVRLGMEPTYYWDGLSDEALDWLNAHTPPGYRVRFASFPTSLLYLKKTGRLTAPIFPVDRGVDAWYVLQNRPGAMRSEERDLLTKAEGRVPFVAARLHTPLVWIVPLNPPPNP